MTNGFARVDFATESDSYAAPDFAPFAESVEALVNLGYVARFFASQDSTIALALLALGIGLLGLSRVAGRMEG